MSTVAPTSPARSAHFNPVTKRFLWKEYRTLRGFWLAALVIAAILQALSVVVSPPGADPVTSIFGIALAAAALYAVGVAATTFSMEHEEETYGFLSGLPARWFPLFAGKLSFAAASAFALALALMLTGYMLAGMRFPGTSSLHQLLATFGFAMVEMLAWGTLFSLLLRQPLLAALLAIGAESLALTWVVNVFVEGSLPAMSLASYAAVLPARAAIVVCVFSASVLLARRWLVLDGRGAAPLAESAAGLTTSTHIVRHLLRFAIGSMQALTQHYSPRVLSHLFWQYWRQSWRPMLAMSILVPFVCVSIVLISGLGQMVDNLRNHQVAFLPFAFTLFAMALYWSAVFYADQRGQKYRFLAEHAVWPRYVWLTRLAVWSLPVTITLVLAAILTASGAYDVLGYWRRHIEQMVRHQYMDWELQYMAQEWRAVDLITRGLIFGLWGALLGLALGQATSLFFRRALVAGFAALVITLPLLIWGMAIWVWELPPSEFLLPLAVGLLVATWLRVPDWLVDRNTWFSWLKVFAAIAIPTVFVAWRLPAARVIPEGIERKAIWQIQSSIGAKFVEPIDGYMPFDAGEIVAGWIDRAAVTNTRQQQATADRLVRLAESIEKLAVPTRSNPDVELPQAEADERARLKVDLNQTIVREAVQFARQDYRFSVSEVTFNNLERLVYLLSDAARVAMLDGNLDASLDYHLAALTLWEKLVSSLSTNRVISPDVRHGFQARLVDWAAAPGQNSERIKRAIAALESVYPPVNELQPGAQSIDSLSSWTPPPQIVATYESLRNIIVGKEPSSLLGERASFDDYAAVIANELPFERQRALRILDLLMINEVAQWRDVIWRTNEHLLQEWARDTIKARGEGGIENMGESLRYKIQRGYSYSFGGSDKYTVDNDYPPYSWLRTSSLLRMELEHRRPFGDWLASIVDKQIAAWGLRQQLALIAYRLNHDEYPSELAALVPDFLPFVPIDPYAGRPFEYRPAGVPLEFRNYRDSGRMGPNTPFFWSVGPENAHLEIQITYDAVDPLEGPSEGEMGGPSEDEFDVRQEIYTLRGNNSYWRLSRPLVFALPKSPAAQVDSDQPIP